MASPSGTGVGHCLNSTPHRHHDWLRDGALCRCPGFPAAPSGTGHDTARPRRFLSCIEEWPDCESGEYHPRCCRFPKSCSCRSYSANTPESELEPVAVPGPVGWECDGSNECAAPVHLHGCYSDDGTNCDHPSEHAHAAPGPASVSPAEPRELAPIDTRDAIDALVQLRGKVEDKQLVARTLGLLEGRIEFLLDVPEIAAAIARGAVVFADPVVSPADTPESEYQANDLKTAGQISGDPVVSPAEPPEERDPFADDVLERLIQSNQNYQLKHGHYIVPLAHRLLKARAECAALLAVGERDRQRIAQLTEALREAQPIVASIVAEFDAPADAAVLAQVDAVLADKEDADGR